jgi:hypothetical protein
LQCNIFIALQYQQRHFCIGHNLSCASANSQKHRIAGLRVNTDRSPGLFQIRPAAAQALGFLADTCL